jgi:hypothetical protein
MRIPTTVVAEVVILKKKPMGMIFLTHAKIMNHVVTKGASILLEQWPIWPGTDAS